MTIPRSPGLKLERAGEHLGALGAAIAAYSALKPYQAIKEPDADGKGYALKFRLDPPIPSSLSLLVGDAAHNMRSALDHLVWQLVMANGQTPDEQTMFPISRDVGFAGDRAAFLKQKQGAIGKCAPAVQAEIEALQPYHLGDAAKHDPLWIVHDLDRIDKHREVHIIAGQWRLQPGKESALYLEGTLVEDPENVFLIGTLDDGAILGHYGAGDDPQADLDRHFATRIAFDFSGPAAGAGLEKMQTLYEYVRDQVFPRFARFFPD